MEQYYYAIGGFILGLLLGWLSAWQRGLDKRASSPADSAAIAAPAKPKESEKSGEDAIRLLALLQAESRIVDFLFEDISSYSDAQVGQAVRDIHAKAAAALRQHAEIRPILQGTEGSRVTVPKGFDPSAVRVLGNVSGDPPYQGEIQHPGWKVHALKLPALSANTDRFVLQPAEVQIQ